MAKNIRVRGEAQKAIIKYINSIEGKYSRWEIWQDFIIMSACSIANAIGGNYFAQREEMYQSRAGKYSPAEMKVFAEMLFEVTEELERNPDQDFLGELFMMLDLGNEWKGQFFTPYSVCRCMAAMNSGNDIQAKIDQQGWISVLDPACGAGALLVAFANHCWDYGRGVNYQTAVLFVAQDIDMIAGLMCYIQLSLLGCAGYVVIDDSLAHPSTSYDSRGLLPKESASVWYTPFYFRKEWTIRKIAAQMALFFSQREQTPPAEAVEEIKTAPVLPPATSKKEKARKEPIKKKAETLPEAEPFHESSNGQLSFF